MIPYAKIQLRHQESGKDRKIRCVASQGWNVFDVGPFNGTGAERADDVCAIVRGGGHLLGVDDIVEETGKMRSKGE